jgi:hypothetical protein
MAGDLDTHTYRYAGSDWHADRNPYPHAYCNAYVHAYAPTYPYLDSH